MHVLKQFSVGQTKVAREPISLDLSIAIPAAKQVSELNLSATLRILVATDPCVDLHQV